MLSKLKDLIMQKAKEGQFLNEKEAKAKSAILDEIDDIMKSKMKGKISKIMISASDKEGLKTGLHKAEEMVDGEEAMSNAEKIKELQAKLDSYK